MTESETGSSGERNWDDESAILRKRKESRGGPRHVIQQQSPGAIVPAAPSGVPADLVIPLPDFEAQRGIYLDWKEGRMTRKLAIARLAELHRAHMEVLKASVKEGVRIQIAGITIRARAVLEEMQREYLKSLAQLDIQNAAERLDAVLKLNDVICAKVDEVKGKDWPKELKDQTIEKAFALQERIEDRIMAELGSEVAGT